MEERKFILIQGHSINVDRIDYYLTKIQLKRDGSKEHVINIIVNGRELNFPFEDEESWARATGILNNIANIHSL